MRSGKPGIAHRVSQSFTGGRVPARKIPLRSFSGLRFSRDKELKDMLGTRKPLHFTPQILTDSGDPEEQMGETKTVLQTFFDGISDPLLLLGRGFSVKMLNSAAARYYGNGEHERQEVIGKQCYEALRGRTEPCEECPYPSVILNRHGGAFKRKGLMDPEKFEQVLIDPTQIGILIRIRDITRTKFMERQLVESQKLASLGVLVSGIIHEIKNLNNCITFNIPILEEYLRDLIPIIDDYAESHQRFELFGMSYPKFREDIFNLLGNLEHASGRISVTVSSLGEFVGRSDRGKRRWVDLKQVMERGTAICHGQVKKTVKSFEVDVAEDLPQIFTDPEALEQVVVNLLINAAQAADKEDSRVWLTVRRGDSCGDHVVMEVTDNGCGMEEEIRRKVFEPFFSTKKSGRGTGLGLFVSHNLVEEMGGYIEVESEPGKGSTFRVILNDMNNRT